MPEGGLWTIIKQSLISHALVLVVGALCAAGGSYLAMRDVIMSHEYRIAAIEKEFGTTKEAVRVHHEAAAGETMKLNIACGQLTRMENMLTELWKRGK